MTNVITQTGSEIVLDGTVVTQGFTPIGSTGYGVARVPLSTGSHTMTGTSPFGLQVYRYAPHTSYTYPGGPSKRQGVRT